MQRAKYLKSNKQPKSSSQSYSQLESSNSRLFDIMFVCNDEEQSVEVVESPTIDFNKVIEQLRQGNSVFIAPKNQSSNRPTSKKQSNKQKSGSSVSHA
jgi:hypothetical protein